MSNIVVRLGVISIIAAISFSFIVTALLWIANSHQFLYLPGFGTAVCGGLKTAVSNRGFQTGLDPAKKPGGRLLINNIYMVFFYRECKNILNIFVKK